MSDLKLRAYIDRVLRSREREDAEKTNTKQIYAELAGDGYDKTIVGKVVNHLRKDQDKVREQSDLFDTYLIAYLGASHVHTRAREAGADPETGEIPGSHAPAQLNGVDPETPAVAPAVGESADNSDIVDAISAQTEPGEPAPSSNAGTEAVEGPATVSEPADRLAADADSDGGATATAPVVPQTAAVAPDAAEPGDRSAVIPAAAPVAAKPDFTKPNPICQDPEDCGVHASWNHTCGSCLRRKAAVEAGAALQ